MPATSTQLLENQALATFHPFHPGLRREIVLKMFLEKTTTMILLKHPKWVLFRGICYLNRPKWISFRGFVVTAIQAEDRWPFGRGARKRFPRKKTFGGAGIWAVPAFGIVPCFLNLKPTKTKSFLRKTEKSNFFNVLTWRRYAGKETKQHLIVF